MPHDQKRTSHQAVPARVSLEYLLSSSFVQGLVLGTEGMRMQSQGPSLQGVLQEENKVWEHCLCHELMLKLGLQPQQVFLPG